MLLSVESGTLTVRSTDAAVVSRGMRNQEEIPAETAFTMNAGDSYVSQPVSRGVLRNEGTEDVSRLVSIIVPIPAATPTP